MFDDFLHLLNGRRREELLGRTMLTGRVFEKGSDVGG
jgi:hypothetical protein